MTFPPVLNKVDFSRRYADGEFGNRPPTWLTLEAFLKETIHCPPEYRYHLRNKETAGSTYFHQNWSQIASKWEKMERPQQWYVSQMAPDRCLTIQGEVMQACYGSGGAGLDLYYSHDKSPQRTALARDGRQVSGIRATILLRHFMCPASWDWLNVLLDRYPGHVVELSCFDREWGSISGYNTVFWETRLY